MEHVEVAITIEPYSSGLAEILMAHLAEHGFDSFSEESNKLLAYISRELFEPERVNECISNLKANTHHIAYSCNILKPRNWNEVWESNFGPMAIENFCRVRAPFHPSEAGYKMELVIEPKMAFGTGHHQTTWLMTRQLFSMDIEGKSVLDMGCGTGILAIVAEKLGARTVTAIDNDEWAYANTIENAQKNGCERINTLLGDSGLLKGSSFDIILANINLNILLADMGAYVKSLNTGGFVLFSGIFTADVEKLRIAAEKEGLRLTATRSRDDWAMAVFKL